VSILSGTAHDDAQAVSRLGYLNPFLPERRDGERAVLGDDFEPGGPVWSVQGDTAAHPNLPRIRRKADALAETMREPLAAGVAVGAEERRIYEDVVAYLLYDRHEAALYELIERGRNRARVAAWPRFAADLAHFADVLGDERGLLRDPAHLFACFFQVRRAFHHVFRFIVGGSMPAARLRAAAWQSIFTHDMRRYRRALYQSMGDVTTLVTGPSGTGKELVARAIGLSRYVPFDPRTGTFTDDWAGGFQALNLSAFSPTLIESELFGHQRGAFTGALADRAGWLETCGPRGAVFLDEIGELDPGIQVKLLRVLQARTFQRLGDTTDRHFGGKIIAATNRDLAAEMAAGRFRDDLYYRLCADLIETPSLRAQLDDAPDELRVLVDFIARRVVGDDEAEPLAGEVLAWIETQLGADYPWPGNVRELEQCVRNVLIRREYRPPAPGQAGARDALADAVRAGTLTADELLNRYCTLVFADSGSYLESARRLGLDRRTVKSRVDTDFLATLPRRSGN
jgi:hypothetical protein